MSDVVKFENRDAIALLTINRPAKLNALNYATNDRLLDLLDGIENDHSVRAVILTGAGDRAFSAGGDIPEFTQSIKDGVDIAVADFCRRGQTMTARLESFPKPIIAAVNGIALAADARSRKPCTWPWQARKRSLPNPRSISAFLRHSAERKGCPVWPAGKERLSFF